jgi:hypothetical protein
MVIIWRQVRGFFFGGEIVGYGLNQSLGVDGLVHIFNSCDCQIGRGNILVEHTSQHSLMNCSMLITLGKGFLNCSLTTLFTIFLEPIVVLESQ